VGAAGKVLPVRDRDHRVAAGRRVVGQEHQRSDPVGVRQGGVVGHVLVEVGVEVDLGPDRGCRLRGVIMPARAGA